MSNDELQTLVRMVSQRYFAKPFNHQATFNARLKTTGGRYFLKTHDIEINPKILERCDRATLIGVIKHELCHYHLHMAGFSGKHGTTEFKKLLKTVGGARFSPAVLQEQGYLYECVHCHLQYRRKRKVDLQKYVCGKCHARLKLIKK